MYSASQAPHGGPPQSMKLFVANTDGTWFSQLRAMALRQPLDEVNFWRPSGASFRALTVGEMFLFKLHAPRSVIAGGGFFSRAAQLPVRLAWEAFGYGNGVQSEAELQARLRHYRGHVSEGAITNIILSEPFFFPDGKEIPLPSDFPRNIQFGKGYELESASGARLFQQVGERLAQAPMRNPGPAQFTVMTAGERFGPPRAVAPRMGQGGFRVGVLENYRRRCAISGERTIPVLEAAHIRRYTDGGGHELRNGLLLRSDLHRLFDRGYLAVDPGDRRVLVSPRIREEFENGRDYYALHGRTLAPPAKPNDAPDPDSLEYHLTNVFRG